MPSNRGEGRRVSRPGAHSAERAQLEIRMGRVIACTPLPSSQIPLCQPFIQLILQRREAAW